MDENLVVGKVNDINGVQQVDVKRPNNNDCWNVAYSLATDKSYSQVRKELVEKIKPRGTIAWESGIDYLKEHGYELNERLAKQCRTPLTLARETSHMDKEFVVDVRGHVLYIRNGVVHDSPQALRKHIKRVWERRISE